LQLEPTEEQQLLRDTFAQLFAGESSPERVRAAEPLGFDPALWKQLAETGALVMRVPEASGGAGANLLDAVILAEEAGRKLASSPLVETIVAARVLASCSGDAASSWLERLSTGASVVSIALHDFAQTSSQWVAGGAVADAVVGRDGDDLVLLFGRRLDERADATPRNLGSDPLGLWSPASSERLVLASGQRARDLLAGAIEEWKLLTASALAGLSREALEIAGRYASERIQFGRPIGAFQAIAHPLADSVADIDGARLLVWRTVWAIASRQPEAGALISMCFVWAAEATTRAVARALHTHGGYGLSLEYDIQLYHRRGKSLPLAYGDPRRELLTVADRLWGQPAAAVILPDPGDVHLDYGLGEPAEAFAEAARRFFEEKLSDELRAHRHFAWEGHHPGFQAKLAEAGLLYPAWPSEYGGQDRGRYEMVALSRVFDEFGWSRYAITTTDMVAQTLMRFGSEELKLEVLPRIARGDAISSLGYTEPASGSDVAAAQTRAVRDGDDWIINGQKMFTSGADLAQYVFLLTRTNTEVPKHKGLTMFMVPLDLPGIEIQPVHTISDERTNCTYYTEVRLPDRYRVGPVDGGWSVVAYALELEHGGGGSSTMRRMLAGAVSWAEAERLDRGRPLDDSDVRARLARVAIHIEVIEAISARSLFVRCEGIDDPGLGPISKFFSTDRFIEDAADLMDLCAPDSLLRGAETGFATGAAAVEFAYRLSTATSIYGGTSEIMKSIVAQASLGMPRSRS
jgi:alkylation response protein AidB-like acyl-CoA dehydrogenase